MKERVELCQQAEQAGEMTVDVAAQIIAERRLRIERVKSLLEEEWLGGGRLRP